MECWLQLTGSLEEGKTDAIAQIHCTQASCYIQVMHLRGRGERRADQRPLCISLFLIIGVSTTAFFVPQQLTKSYTLHF